MFAATRLRRRGCAPREVRSERSYAPAGERRKVGPLPLFANPLIGFFVAFEAGVSAGERAKPVNMDAVRSVSVGDDQIGGHAF
jgi:hypothetical protein